MARGVIIGGGAVGVDFHLPRMLGILEMDEVVIVDNSEDRCAQLASRFSSKAQVTVSKEYPRQHHDVSVIATPPKYHLGIFKDLLDYSEKIVIEKPLTRTFSEAESLLSVAEGHESQIYVVHLRRSLDSFSWMKQCYKDNAFGRLLYVDLHEGSIFGWNAVSMGSFSKELNGGGVLMDTGPHAIDQLFQIFDQLELKSAYMDAVPRLSKTAIEANACLNLLGDGEVAVTVALSRNRVFLNHLVFRFETIDVSLGLHNNLVTLKTKSGAELVGTPDEIGKPMTYMDMFDSFYTDFVLKGDNTGVAINDAIKVQKILQEAYDHAETMKGGF